MKGLPTPPTTCPGTPLQKLRRSPHIPSWACVDITTVAPVVPGIMIFIEITLIRPTVDLSAPLIRDFEDRLRKGEPLSPGDKPSPRSAILTRKILVSLGSMIGDAQERGLVSRNDRGGRKPLWRLYRAAGGLSY
jgi:hypothetical protein